MSPSTIILGALLKNGQEGSRTLTTLRPTDFKSVVYAIPPLARYKLKGDERN